jgi:UPF0042 nucleotide-binding protein
MTENDTAVQSSDASAALVLVTGPSGAGRSTAINAFEDLGFEVIDNMPLSLLPRLLEGDPLTRPMALGVDVRNRDFSAAALIEIIDQIMADPRLQGQVLYVDADEAVLVRRYSETRRRHPLAPDDAPLVGIALEKELLVPIRARADLLVDTTELSPHDLRADVDRLFGPVEGRKLGVSVHSFSYKRGLPRGLDLVFDCRFLRNPHWDPALRALDGRDDKVAEYVTADTMYDPFFTKVRDLIETLLPAYRSEGKSHLSIGFGCTGGQHRSVALTEQLAFALALSGWQVSKRHRELERRASAAPVA